MTKVLNYIPETTVSPTLFDLVADKVKPSTIVNQILNSLEIARAKMQGSMKNYGVDEGEEGRVKWRDRAKYIGKGLKYVGKAGKYIPVPALRGIPKFLELSGEAIDKLATISDIAAEIEKQNYKTAAIKSGVEALGNVITGATKEGLKDAADKAKDATSTFVDEAVDQAKDAANNAAEKKDKP